MFGPCSQADDQSSIFRRDGVGTVPLVVSSLPVVQIFSFPVWVVARPETPTIGLELIREDEIHLLTGVDALDDVSVFRGVMIDEPNSEFVCEACDLARRISSSKTKATFLAVGSLEEVGEQWIAQEE